MFRFLASWCMDRYSYLIPSIHRCEQITMSASDTIKNEQAAYNQFFFVLGGKAEVVITQKSKNIITTHTLKKNDVLYIPYCLYYDISVLSGPFEFLFLSMHLYSCADDFFQSNNLDCSKLLSNPVQHRMLCIYLPHFISIPEYNPAHEILAKLCDLLNKQPPGFATYVRCYILELLMELLTLNAENHDSVLCHMDKIAITSRPAQYAILPENCMLALSDIEIWENTQAIFNRQASPVLTFSAKRYYLQEPQDDSIKCGMADDPLYSHPVLKLKSYKDNNYHLWIGCSKGADSKDLRPYKHYGCIRFFAKSNMSLSFGLTLNNTNNWHFIPHVLYIEFPNEWQEFCVPLIYSNIKEELPKPINQAISYIKNHYQEKIRLESIAEYVHFNVSYLATLFKQFMGVSIGEYILSHRVLMAKNILRITDDTVNNVAIKTGFYDTAHFSRSFKSIVGVSPSVYRKIVRKALPEQE